MKTYNVFMDGNAWCTTRGDFVNLHESNAGFGECELESLKNLILIEEKDEIRRCEGIRDWKCECCKTRFSRMFKAGERPPCIYCKAGNQYVHEITIAIAQEGE